MVDTKTPAADEAAGATEAELASVLSDDPEAKEEEFEAAFDEFAAEDDTATATPAAEVREATDEKTGDEATPGEESPGDASDEAASGGAAEPENIWADATPEQRAAFEAAQQENRSHRGRASRLDRLEAASRAPTPAAAPAADAATPETDENWEQFKTEYPEVAAPMEQRFDTRMAKLEAENADLRGQVNGITDAHLQDAIESEEALLVQRHPDWRQLTATEDFHNWRAQQPRYVQEGFARNGNVIVDGHEAASLLDMFTGGATPDAKPSETTATSGKVTRRERRLKSAVQTESGQAGPGAGPPEGDFDAAFDHFAALP